MAISGTWLATRSIRQHHLATCPREGRRQHEVGSLKTTPALRTGRDHSRRLIEALVGVGSAGDLGAARPRNLSRLDMDAEPDCHR